MGDGCDVTFPYLSIVIPHLDQSCAASLADGNLEDDIIECTLHFGAFNVKTGAAVSAPCFVPLRTYKVAVRDGQVVVDLDKSADE